MNRIWLAVPLTVAAIGLTACSGASTESASPLPEGVTGDTVTGSASTGSGVASDRGPGDAFADRDVIRTATVTVVLPDPEPAVTRIQQLATSSEGYLQSVSTGSTPTPCAEGEPCPAVTSPQPAAAGVTTVVLRVPAAAYDDTMTQLRDLGEVVGLDVSADDVTTQVTDLDARIRAQRDSVERVRQLMKQASSLSDVVKIEQELAARQAELESLESQKRVLDQSVSLATITAVLVPQAVAEEFVGPDSHWWDPPWQAFVSAWQGLLVLLAALSPLIIAGAVAAGAVAAVMRRRRRTRDRESVSA